MNNPIKIIETKLLSDNWGILTKVTYDYRKKNGEKETHIREIYDRGNGAAILLYNKKNRTVILTRQFRLPTFLNGNSDGRLIEACAGLLDGDSPEDCAKKEALEETGYQVTKVRKIFESYMTPGADTEILHFFVGEYNKNMKVSEGGGLDEEQEHIEVLDLDFDEAFDMIESGEIRDAKTIMLLQYVKIHRLV
ncbi:MAG TPA: GDP-mannose pyrophosphatase NudK [Flavobacteriaceae bacterium]|nr:GDP-mannose pyrophosphatase NudK [Flavobacteriaceae bacterium]